MPLAAADSHRRYVVLAPLGKGGLGGSGFVILGELDKVII